MLKRFFVLALICMGSLYWLYERTIAQTSLTWSRWGYSEWLINYQGGFVRRGLPGEIVHHLAGGGEALQGVNGFLFGVCGLVLVLWTLLLIIQKKIPLWAAVVSFLMPGSLIHALATNQFFYRKEISFTIPLLMAAIGLVLLGRHPKKGIFFFFATLSALLGVAATLFHETFFLAGLPALCLMWSYGWRSVGIKPGRRRRLVCLFSAPIILAFIFSCLYSGGPDVSQEIWNSLTRVDQERLFSEPSTPRAPFIAERPHKAISALASNAPAEILWVGVSFLESGFGLWILILGSVIFCLSAWLKVCTGKGIMEDSRKKALWSIVVFLFVCELPIYLFSEDWGRWIAWFGTAVLIVWISVWSFQDLTSFRRPHFLDSVAGVLNSWPQWSYKGALVGLILWNFFFSIPETGFSDRLKKNIFRAALFVVVDEARFADFVHRAERVDPQDSFRVKSRK